MVSLSRSVHVPQVSGDPRRVPRLLQALCSLTLLLLMVAVAAMTLWRLAPLPLILGGVMAGVAARVKPLQRLKELV